MNKLLNIIILSGLLLVSSNLAQSVSKTGTTAAKFLSIGIGPRANAMGAAFSAVTNDATSMYWNPSGIANASRFEGVFTYTKLFADVDVNFIGFVLPLGGDGAIGVSVTALNIGEMEVTTELQPDGTGEVFSSGSYAFGLSYARFITENFAVGATFKYIREDIYNSSAQGLALDIGTIFNTPFYDIKFASSITNFGTKMKIDGDDLIIRYDPDETTSGNNETNDAKLSTDEFELPLRLQIGLSREWKFYESQKFIFAVDVNYPNDNKQWVNVGGELSFLNELVSIRGGYKTLFLEDTQEGLTLGGGLKYNLGYIEVAVDYSFQEYEYLSNVHSFGVNLKF